MPPLRFRKSSRCYFSCYGRREAEASDKLAVEVVMEDLEARRVRLEAEAEELSVRDDPRVPEQLDYIYEQLDELDTDKALAKASSILHGLGFDAKMQKTVRDTLARIMWRHLTRIAAHQGLLRWMAHAYLARQGAVQLPDASTARRAHQSLVRALNSYLCCAKHSPPSRDLEACVWLERYLKKWKHILLLVSHSQDFLNNVCTNIVLLRNQTLSYWSGNYDQYVKTRKEQEENQMKQYNWEQGAL